MEGAARVTARAAGILLVAVILSGIVSVRASVMAHDDGALAVEASTTTAYLSVMEAGADVIANADPTHNLSASDPFSGLAYQADALARAARAVAASDPARSQRYTSVAITIANYLVRHDALAPNGQLGWGRPDAWDAFGDGTVNPAHQVYAFQTALVSWALLDVYTLTHNTTYLTTVERVMASYLPHSTTRLGANCHSCRMFWYSTNANDAGRYVKNTNVLMGHVMALLYGITGGSGYHTYATQVYNEETYEIVQRGNYRYLGVNDPHFRSAVGPDAHIVLETFGYSQIAALLRIPASQTRATFDRMVSTFWKCGGKCYSTPIASGFTPPLTIYTEFMTCYPVSFNSAYLAGCARMISNPALPHLSPFPLVGLLYALPSVTPALPPIAA